MDPWGWINLNTNGATGNFGVYEILADGEVHKYGKADSSRITQSSGLPTRLHQQLRKLTDSLGEERVKGRVIKTGHKTTVAAKATESAKLAVHYDATGKIPLVNQKSYKPKATAGC